MTYRSQTSTTLTLAEYQALPDDDGYRDELSRGYLIREPQPGAEHGHLVARLTHMLMTYVDAHPGCGRAFTECGFLLQEDPVTLRGPDVAFVSAARIGAKHVGGFFRGAPDLAIEVLLPSNRPGEILQKVAEFLEAGTSVVWVVDPRSRSVVIHRQSMVPQIVGEAECSPISQPCTTAAPMPTEAQRPSFTLPPSAAPGAILEKSSSTQS